MLAGLIGTSLAIDVLGRPWLHLFYIVIFVLLPLRDGPRTVIPLSLAVPLLEFRHFLDNDRTGEIALSALVVLIATVLSLIMDRLRHERDAARRSLARLREEAEELNVGAVVNKVAEEGFASQHLSARNKADEEIREVLAFGRHVFSATAITFLELKNNTLTPRCSAGAGPAAVGRSQVSLEHAVQQRKPVAFPRSRGTEAGVAIPVMDGSFVAGVLAIEREGEPFAGPDVGTFDLLSRQIVRILHRQRLYAQVNREHTDLNILQKSGEELRSCLRLDDFVQSLIAAAHRIAPVMTAFILSRDEQHELIRSSGFSLPAEPRVKLEGSLVGMAIRNLEPFYLSDLREVSEEVLPFKAGVVAGSAFILPLVDGGRLLGALVMFSERPQALNSYQIGLLRMLGNQATVSLANARLHEEIERMAATDGLTGLYNHRRFQEMLSDELRRLQRIFAPLSLLLIDIDFFKKVNDTYGHPAGDEILRSVAAILRETMRNVDVPARYGGEEFAAILPGTNQAGARETAERIRKAVEQKAFTVDNAKIPVTVSIGVSTAPYDAESKEGLIERADQALYHAKRSGRDRTVLWEEISHLRQPPDRKD